VDGGQGVVPAQHHIELFCNQLRGRRWDAGCGRPGLPPVICEPPTRSTGWKRP